MNKIRNIFLSLFILVSIQGIADEGMWIPLLLEKYNIADMQELGFKLTAEDIYSINQACLIDAVIIFGGGCTGELISDQGLIITNHHCGYGQIQSHSSVEHDYLTDGFWAMNKEEELINPDLTVQFLVKMEDVTEKILSVINDNMVEADRQQIIDSIANVMTEEAVKDTHYDAIIKPFYYGNEYYMFVYEEFKDVRLVGAPPSSIGKFGGDTDNWMWPRHTGDFSLFRIYADKDNKPAEYSEDNIPYKPKKYFPISLKGVEKDDFTLVFGYPGTTQEYLTSYAVKMISEVENPHQIKLREKRLAQMKIDMDASDEVRIKYATKHARVANYWKKWIGENRGLKKLDAIEKKQILEEEFQAWANSNNERKEKYGNLLPQFNDIYTKLTPYQLAENYIYEGAYAVELIRFGRKFRGVVNKIAANASEEELNEAVENLKKSAEKFYKDYNMPTDKKVFSTLLKMYYDNLDKKFHPDFFTIVETKYKGDFAKYADFVYGKSIVADKEKMMAFLDKFNTKSLKKLYKDPAYQIFASVNNFYAFYIYPIVRDYSNEVDSLNRFYVRGLREMHNDKVFYPDANFTLRITYGKVSDYYPANGVHYNYFTTIDGIIEKDDPEIYDYDVPDKLRELYENKDYGQYADKDGTVHVCFIGTNHTSGGNSGSPVLNADGHLIGINFDRNWEGTMSDIMYDPDQCRNITLDIRYALFIIDKMAGASHLIEEMTLITE